jgi:hypothetical protein
MDSHCHRERHKHRRHHTDTKKAKGQGEKAGCQCAKGKEMIISPFTLSKDDLQKMGEFYEFIGKLLSSNPHIKIEKEISRAPPPLPVCPGPSGINFQTPIYAGRSILISAPDGGLSVSFDGSGDMKVTYQIAAPWTMTSAHLYLENVKPGINPAPGRFRYKQSGLADLMTYSFMIPATEWKAILPFTYKLFMAAQAEVRKIIGYEPPDLNQFKLLLPTGNVEMWVQYPGNQLTPSYFDMCFGANKGNLTASIYDAWCIDVLHTINPGVHYCAKIYSSYDPSIIPLITAIVSSTQYIFHPENIPKVNWIINNTAFFVGCTWGDIQTAMWTLLLSKDLSIPILVTHPSAAYTQANVMTIFNAANTNGAGFVPSSCDQKVMAFILPYGTWPNCGTNPTNQVIFSQIQLSSIGVTCSPIYQEETAWACGPYEFSKKWGWYWEQIYPDP